MADARIYLNPEEQNDEAPYVVLERELYSGHRAMVFDAPGGDLARSIACAAVGVRELGGDWRRLDAFANTLKSDGDKPVQPEWPKGLLDAYDYTRPLAGRLAVMRRLSQGQLERINEVALPLLIGDPKGN